VSCHDLIQALGAYLDGDLSAALHAGCEAHAGACASCRCLIASCRLTIQTYHNHPAAPLPAALHRKLMDQLGNFKPPFGPNSSLTS
jgi:anti-sigma factor RsiW